MTAGAAPPSLPRMGVELEFLTEPAEFLAVAGPWLRQAPVVSTVVATVAYRRLGGEPAGEGDWWLVVRDGAEVVGAGMRTARFGCRPVFLLPMPDPAATALARVLHERGEELGAVNGALPAVRVCAEETARLTGKEAAIAQHTRLFEVSEVVPPRPVPGRLRPAAEAELGLVAAWFEAFMADADEQAGRPRGSSAAETPDEEMLRRRLDDGCLWLWADESDRPVHLTAANPPSLGAARIGPVYTPADQRGRGYASAAVAQVSQRILDGGARPCLFTDQANPTSNRIYQALGYRPVVDMANLLVG